MAIWPFKSKKPPEGETTGRQVFMAQMPGALLNPIAGIPGLIGTSGGAGLVLSGSSFDWMPTDPYAYGGRWIKQWYWGTYHTYRLIAAHPRCQQAFATLTNPIVAGSCDYEKADDSVPDALLEMVKKQLEPLRRRYIEDALQALNLGWQPFEPIWTVKDGLNWLQRLKPLLPDTTVIRTDANGNFTELVNGISSYAPPGNTPVNVEPLTVANNKAFIYSFRPQCGYLYGYPLAENVRLVAWRMWLNAAFQLHGIGEKLSQVIAMGFAPSGTYTDPKTGNSITPMDEMTKALAGLKDTGMAVFANLVAMAKPNTPAADMAKLAQSAMSSIEFYDAGNHSAALAGEIEVMDKAEDLFFAAYLLSSRTGMQSEHGSRADAQQHSDTGLVSSQLIADDLCDSLQPMVDAILTLNAGEQMAGAIKLTASPLVDTKTQLWGELLNTALSDQTVGPMLYGVLDFDAVAQQLDLPVQKGSSANDAVKEGLEAKKQQQADAAKALTQGKPGDDNHANGNGKATKELSMSFSRMFGLEDN